MGTEAQQIDFDNATEDQLAALRGDSLEAKTEEPEANMEEPEAESEVQAQAAEVEPEGEPAQEPEPEPEQKTPPLMIPKSRYDAVMARLKALEAQSQQPQQQPEPVEQAPDLDSQLAEIDAQIADAVKDGDGEKAAALMRQSRMLQMEMMQQQLSQVQTTATTASRESIKYDALVDAVEQLLPEVNPDNADTYDDGLVMQISELKDAFERQGKSPSEALRRALNYVKPGWDQPPVAQEPSPSPVKETKPAPRQTDVRKNLDAAKSQPPRMDSGENSDVAGLKGKIDVFKLPDKDFESLTEEQLAELRGDNY